MIIQYCKNCGMPNTRPGIYFDEVGYCQGCIYELDKDHIKWNDRWRELNNFVKAHKSYGKYDVVIAVSGGKDSYFQTFTFKDRLGLNCLLVCVDDNMRHTEVGKHNLENLAEEFDCDLMVYKMKKQTQRRIMRFTFENYNKPFWVIDRLIYTVPIQIAKSLGIPIVVYGENVAVTRGLKDNKDIPSAWNQINNSVVSDIKLKEVAVQCGVYPDSISMLEAVQKEEVHFASLDQYLVNPIYTSYFCRWDAYENYLFALTRGFWDLSKDPEWNNRWGGFMDFWQIDSFGYLMAFYSKWANLGHSGFTDCVCELIRAGHITKERGEKKILMWEGTINDLAMDDFCKFLHYTKKEVLEINRRHHNNKRKS